MCLECGNRYRFGLCIVSGFYLPSSAEGTDDLVVFNFISLSFAKF